MFRSNLIITKLPISYIMIIREMVMAGYLCDRTKCNHCEKSYPLNGACTESNCECTKYTKGTQFSKFC